MLGEITELRNGNYSVVVNEESGKVEVVKTLEEAEMIRNSVLSE